jgi:hypothetical protein
MLEARACTPQLRESLCGRSRDEGFQPETDQLRLFLNPCELCGTLQEHIIDIERCTHMHHICMSKTSFVKS